jgi:hypothetical protein
MKKLLILTFFLIATGLFAQVTTNQGKGIFVQPKPVIKSITQQTTKYNTKHITKPVAKHNIKHITKPVAKHNFKPVIKYNFKPMINL